MLRLIIVSESDSKIARKFEKNVIFVWEMIVTCVHTAVFCGQFGRRHASVSKNRMNNR